MNHLQGDGTVMNPRVAKVAEKVHVQALEKKYGTSVKVINRSLSPES